MTQEYRKGLASPFSTHPVRRSGVPDTDLTPCV